MEKIQGVIFDWAGTTVDFGCFAPVNVFVDIFKNKGIEVTMKEAREPMGMLKMDHIHAMLNMPRIYDEWKLMFGKAPTDQDVIDLYNEFEPALMSSLNAYTDPIPEVTKTVELLRERGLKIGSTTGYTQSMMDIVVPSAMEKGYRPDYYCTPDDTESYGRPYPYMIYRNIEELKLPSAWQVVKVGDTISDIKEAINAGVWSVGVTVGSSEMGLNKEEFAALTKTEYEIINKQTKQNFLNHGADFTISSMNQLPQLIKTINQLITKGRKPGFKST